MDSLTRTLVVLACVFCAALVGCTSAPQASLDRDATAKEFLTHPDASAIYVYRSRFNYYDTDVILYMDGRVMGTAVPGAYFRLDTTPGRHTLHGTGVDAGEVSLETRAGQLYFVSLNVIGGHSHFRIEPEGIGREHVRACCALVEPWAPGQRGLVLR